MTPLKILVTGSTGFVGSGLVNRLATDCRFEIIAAGRRGSADRHANVHFVRIPDLAPDTDWGSALSGVAVVVHTAARVHVMRDDVTDPLAEFRRVNVEGALNLAKQAAVAGARRFVFISSIKVNGESTCAGAPFLADDEPAPVDPYAISKLEAEYRLRALAAETSMEIVIIRPTLVYGPGVKANFLSMMRWLYKGRALPFGAIHNQRSLVALGNLVDLIVICLEHPKAANQTFLVSDDDDLSTTELLRLMGNALGQPTLLLPVPTWLLKIGAAVLGKRALSQRLFDSLQVDISKTKNLLGWTPPLSVDESLRATAQYFLTDGGR